MPEIAFYGAVSRPRTPVFKTRRQIMEEKVEALLSSAESLIAILDRQDGDNDLEDEHDGREPEYEGDELDRGELDTADDEPPAHPEFCGGTYGAPGANWGRP